MGVEHDRLGGAGCHQLAVDSGRDAVRFEDPSRNAPFHHHRHEGVGVGPDVVDVGCDIPDREQVGQFPNDGHLVLLPIPPNHGLGRGLGHGRLGPECE